MKISGHAQKKYSIKRTPSYLWGYVSSIIINDILQVIQSHYPCIKSHYPQYDTTQPHQEAISVLRQSLTSIWISIINIRWSQACSICTMGIITFMKTWSQGPTFSQYAGTLLIICFDFLHMNQFLMIMICIANWTLVTLSPRLVGPIFAQMLC